MINNIEKYADIANDILKRVPIIRTEQMKLIIQNYLETDDRWCSNLVYGSKLDNSEKTRIEFSESIVFGLQRAGYLLLSPDGWCMSKGAFKKLVPDRFERHILIDDVYRIPNISNLAKDFDQELIQAMWVVASMYPISKDFVVGSKPWDISFIIPENGEICSRLFQICSVSLKNADAKCELLRTICQPNELTYTEGIRRIAIVDSSTLASKIPYLGFHQIIRVDEGIKDKYEIISARNEKERWLEKWNS